jgi:transaldolase
MNRLPQLHVAGVSIWLDTLSRDFLDSGDFTALVDDFAVSGNVTLLFSVERYEEVIEAYLRGLERRVAAGEPIDRIASVASFFVSRVDAEADAALAPGSPLRGRVAIANARVAYGRYLDRFAGERWRVLQECGARPQRPLRASTGTNDSAYSDVLYVEQLIAPGVINTMPEKTLRAFADQGEVEVRGG